uniref:MIF4G domain-containing protein n=1 Tax=viral metagenome TaxID=1070528 RepID=A0A6C0DWJ1_9ZZZZ
MKYTLKDFTNVIFDGFDYTLPEETIALISELSLEVGSPSYIKTPVFQKRENPLKASSSAVPGGFPINTNKKRRGNKNMEVLNDDDWETLRTFQTTKIEQKVGLDAQIDLIRSHLNKMSDKSYIDMRNKIVDLLDQLISEGISREDMMRVSTTIFDIASTNRFFSKLYADLYSDLINKYDIMKEIFTNCFESFMELFNNIEYVDADKDYDKFCKINKDNERRKALSAFFVNLMKNEIITATDLKALLCNLMRQLVEFIKEDNKKNIVDELTENIALLYSKTLFDEEEQDEYLIDGSPILETITKLANSKVKMYPSLSNKSIFKFMDMIEM